MPDSTNNGIRQGISKEAFLTLRKRYCFTSSWALWREPNPDGRPLDGISDCSIFDEDGVWKRLRPQYVFVGLNRANGVASKGPLAMFHSERPTAKDYKLRHALFGTEFWGGYITDVLHDMVGVNSGAIMRAFRADRDLAERQIADFWTEIEDVERVCGLPGKPLLIAMGGAAFSVLKQAQRNGQLVGYDAIKISHYSMYGGQEDYRRAVLGALSFRP